MIGMKSSQRRLRDPSLASSSSALASNVSNTISIADSIQKVEQQFVQLELEEELDAMRDSIVAEQTDDL